MRPRLLKALGILAGLAILVAGAIYFVSERNLNASPDVASETLPAITDSASIAEGGRLVHLYGCTECHGPGLAGTNFIESGAFMYLPAPNLTTGPGGVGGSLTVAAWERAIRHGIGADGRPLIIMPSEVYVHLTDADVSAIVSFAKSVSTASSDLVVRRIGPMGRVVSAIQADELIPSRTIDHSGSHTRAIAAEVSIEFGRYRGLLCRVCHGEDLGGQEIDFGEKTFASNLTRDLETGLGAWTEEDFVRLMRTGLRPDDRQVGDVMPWKMFARMTDMELAAIWLDLRARDPVVRTKTDG